MSFSFSFLPFGQSSYIPQAGLKLLILLPQPPKYWILSSTSPAHDKVFILLSYSM